MSYKNKLNEKSAKVKLLFDCSLGEDVVKILDEELNPSHVVGKTVEETYFNLGKRDALIYIKELLKFNGE